MKEKELDTIINKYGADPSEIMGMLLDIQEKEKYLPKRSAAFVRKLGSLDQDYQLLLYGALSLKP